jgi:hypothetical protein
MNDAAVIDTHTSLTLFEQGDGFAVLGINGTEYRLTLKSYKPLGVEIGKRVRGTIHADARRLDTCDTGGRFIEPVYGSPFRMQGNIVTLDKAAQTVTINCCVPVVLRVGKGQNAAEFEPGDFITTGIMPGASFIQAG